MTLETFFKDNPSIALGFSGGVDSSYLLYASLHYGAKVNAYFVKTAFQPEFELLDAYRLAEQLDTRITILEQDILKHTQVTNNPPDRCYYCKQAIFHTLCKQAAIAGASLVIDGTNASDQVADRPGMKALAELSVRSPLRECGITKEEVRRVSKEAGLFTWNKPAYACLATRIPYGQPINAEILECVENAENHLFSLGFTDFRVRVLNDAAKLQFPDKQLDKALELRTDILQALRPYFSEILLDLEGR